VIEQRWRSVESAAVAQKAVPIGEDATPRLTDEALAQTRCTGSSGEGANEDLLDELMRQRRRHVVVAG
jgi:hypothetical protein